MHSLKHSWPRWLGLAVAAACTLFFVRHVAELLGENRQLDLSTSTPLLGLAAIAYMAAYALFALGWHLLLIASGSRAGFAQDFGIFTTSQFAKYIPGNVAHHAGRVVLSTRYGYHVPVVVASMIVELTMVIAAMLLLAVPALPTWMSLLPAAPESLVAAIGAVAALSCALAYALWRLRSHPRVAGIISVFNVRSIYKQASSFHLLSGFVAITFGVIATSVSLALLDSQGRLVTGHNLPNVIVVFSAAWLLGFIVPGAPAGLGVREIVLTGGLTPVIGVDDAIVVTLLFRLVSVLCDLFAFLLGVVVLWRSFGHRPKQLRTP